MGGSAYLFSLLICVVDKYIIREVCIKIIFSSAHTAFGSQDASLGFGIINLLSV